MVVTDRFHCTRIQYIPRNMHTVFALLWLIFPYPSGLLHWHCGNLTIAPVPAKQPWWIWINTSCGFIMNDCITTTKQSTTKPCAYFLGYTVHACPIMGKSTWGFEPDVNQRSCSILSKTVMHVADELDSYKKTNVYHHDVIAVSGSIFVADW